MKHKSTVILLIIVLSSCFTIVNVYSTSDTAVINDMIWKVEVGETAPDFTVTDVDTHITYKLSDFAGKPVLVSFFATWCTYCKQEIPHLVEFYEIFGDDLQMISIDVDTSETEKEISSFRKSFHMDWIVGADQQNIDDAYGVSGIPHLVIIDQEQKISYQLIGFTDSYAPYIKEEIYKLLPDEISPEVTDFQYTIEKENLSIYSPELRIFANITENREISKAELVLTGDGSTREEVINLTPKHEGEFFIINETVSISTDFIYPQSEVHAKLIVQDFKENEDISDTLIIPVVHYEDEMEPDIVTINIDVSEVSDKYQIDVGVTINEDLFLVSANATLLKNFERWYPKPLAQINSTYWETSFTLSKTMAHLCELNLTIELMDVASNRVEETIPVPTDLDPSGCEVEEPTEQTEPTGSTEPTKTPFTSIAVILAIFALAFVLNINRFIHRRK